jgi:hypothetical protein
MRTQIPSVVLTLYDTTPTIVFKFTVYNFAMLYYVNSIRILQVIFYHLLIGMNRKTPLRIRIASQFSQLGGYLQQ